MRITAEQLKAIESAIGRNARAYVIIDEGGRYTGHYPNATQVRVEVVHEDRMVSTEVSLMPFRDMPFRHVAENLVRKMNDYIMHEAFRGIEG